MRPIQVHFITGNKGNVGKTVFTDALIEFYRNQGSELIKIDADVDSRALSRLHSDATLIFLSDNPEFDSEPDAIFQLAEAESRRKSKRRDVVVDLPPGGERHINRWLTECGLNKSAATYGIDFVKWWVCDSDLYSIELFERSLEAYPDVKHVFLKNMGRSSERSWYTFENDKSLQTLIKQRSVPVLEIPRIDEYLLKSLQEKNISFEQARDSVGMTHRMRMSGWLSRVEQTIKAAATSNKEPLSAKV